MRYIYLVFFALLAQANLIAQNFNIVLGRPTDQSITASILFDQNVEFYLEYGTQSGAYKVTSATYKNKLNVPDEIDIPSLTANTKYFYRLNYKLVGSSKLITSPEYSFFTQRAKGSSFTFTVEADEHLYDKKGVINMYKITLANQAADKPDFMLSLGDTFGDDHNPTTITSPDLDYLYRFYRPYLGALTHSVPFYFCLGNHEGQNNYYLPMSPPNNLSVWGTLWRKYYYPNPFPNNFYTGNTESEGFNMGQPENYYAWTWGDALFVVLDVYRYQSKNADSDKPKGWDWTLGLTQYTWLKNTLEGSNAKYKFVFAHHVRGQDRGALTNAKLFEWGGYEQNLSSYTFATNRPGWAKPIHKLFVDTGVNIFFQGHDHLFAHEILDKVTYQEVPMPSDSTYEIGQLANADAYTSDALGGTGHIRVNVTPDFVKVDYVKAYLPADENKTRKNGEIGFSYTINANGTPVAQAPLAIQAGTEDEVNIFPNPVKDRIFIRTSPRFGVKTNALLYTSLGQKILETHDDEIDLRQNSIQAGTYFLKIMNDQNKEVVKKIIVENGIK